jgi:hypothetical protein
MCPETPKSCALSTVESCLDPLSDTVGKWANRLETSIACREKSIWGIPPGTMLTWRLFFFCFNSVGKLFWVPGWKGLNRDFLFKKLKRKLLFVSQLHSFSWLHSNLFFCRKRFLSCFHIIWPSIWLAVAPTLIFCNWRTII